MTKIEALAELQKIGMGQPTAPKPKHRERALLFRNKIRHGAMPEDMFVAQLAAMLEDVEMEAFKRGFNSALASVVTDDSWKGIKAEAKPPEPCAECGKNPCESFIVCQMEAWKRSVTASMASTVMPSVATDPELYRKRFPIVSVPYASACTCGASTTYGAENARQGSPVHARGCDLA